MNKKSTILVAENTETEQPANSVLGILSLQPLLVKYTDGQGKVQTRLVFRVPQNGTCFIQTKTIAGLEVTKAANSWFETSVSKKLAVQEEVESF